MRVWRLARGNIGQRRGARRGLIVLAGVWLALLWAASRGGDSVSRGE